jgi:hypothetical protein
MKKTYYVKLRMNELELNRIIEVQKLTQQKKTEVIREALYLLYLNRYPSLLIPPGQDGQDEMAF